MPVDARGQVVCGLSKSRWARVSASTARAASTGLLLQTELETAQRPGLPHLQAIELYPDFTRDRVQRLAAQQPQNHVPFPARAPPLPGRQGSRTNRRAVGADSAPCTLFD